MMASAAGRTVRTCSAAAAAGSAAIRAASGRRQPMTPVEARTPDEDGRPRKGVPGELQREGGSGALEREQGQVHARRLRRLERREAEAGRPDPEARRERALRLEPGAVLGGGGEDERG